MNDRRVPTPNKWPFYFADALLLGFALWILNHYPHPLPLWVASLMAACVAVAALLGVMPHHLEYQTAVRFAESDGLAKTVTEIRKMESVAESIRLATGQWQGVQEHSNRTVTAAREISDRIAAEAHSFGEFMQKANDSEKAALRLEVEKLRRGEGQWIQVLVHLLDHVFALYQAGARSGQPNLRDQLGQFQEACRDIVRRVGLTPFEATVDEPFDEERHQLSEGEQAPASESRVAQTLATGYTYQGQLLRRPLVALHIDGALSDASASEFETQTEGLDTLSADSSLSLSASDESGTLSETAESSEALLSSEESFQLESDDPSEGKRRRHA